MYEDFLNALLKYVQALNAVTESVEEKEGLTPYIGSVEIMLDGNVVGHLIDEIGGSFSYVEKKTDA